MPVNRRFDLRVSLRVQRRSATILGHQLRRCGLAELVNADLWLSDISCGTDRGKGFVSLLF